ncbi:MAG: rRNA pseudouridine synthase [Eubacteriales bacterium]|nr:rRNA pseudouridine synthase [Eubacteriales bacterium]
MRINKYIALCGAASRRKADELIEAGKISVNGVRVTEPGMDIDEEHDEVTLKGKLLRPQEEKVYYMLNKPVGVISSAKADHGETTVLDLIDDSTHRLYPVGRLDKDSEGLIFVTNDGDFAYTLTHPRFNKGKRYLALLSGEVDEKDLKKLTKGVMLDDRLASANYVRLDKLIKGNSRVEIVISEGRNRQIRRMCEIIGHPVISLKRIEEAGITLGDLKSGSYRSLTAKEVRQCMSQAPEKKTSDQKSRLKHPALKAGAPGKGTKQASKKTKKVASKVDNKK